MIDLFKRRQDIPAWLQRVSDCSTARLIPEQGRILENVAQRVVSLLLASTCSSNCKGMYFDKAPHRSPPQAYLCVTKELAAAVTFSALGLKWSCSCAENSVNIS